ncbi:MAG: hypothetical protein ACREEC_01990 [Thermoplasmata archaeon]
MTGPCPACARTLGGVVPQGFDSWEAWDLAEHHALEGRMRARLARLAAHVLLIVRSADGRLREADT